MISVTNLQQAWLDELGVEVLPAAWVDIQTSPIPIVAQVASPLRQPEVSNRAHQVNVQEVAALAPTPMTVTPQEHLVDVMHCQRCSRHVSGDRHLEWLVDTCKVILVVDSWNHTDPEFHQKQRLLQSIAHAIGLDWATQVGVVPVLRCMDNAMTDADQLRASAIACSGWLTQQLDLVKPMAILAFGGLAASVLVTQQPAKRGSMYLFEGTQPAIATMFTLPLSHILANPIDKAKVWQDLVRFKDLII